MICYCCPHHCGVDRNNQVGWCSAPDAIKIARASLHFDEEPCISGSCGKPGDISQKSRGSGTVFFSHCNLKCVYCQNYEISEQGYGKEITVEEMATILINLQKQGARNINLVTPTIYVCQIKEAIKLAKTKGLSLPIIYNSSGYETVETIRSLQGYIDVYLPDLKYYDETIGMKYSHVIDYFKKASLAILEMGKQVGQPVFDEEGYIQRGMIIRHMILPSYTRDTRKLLEWISENLGVNTYISIMAQYFPTSRAKDYQEINRKITKKEMRIVTNMLEKLGFEHGYVQKLGIHEEEYVPKFDGSGVNEIE